MSRELLKKLADELKETRQEQGYSLEQIYGRTRIDLKFLRAIESGHFDIMPDVYMNAFIKEYAAFIGLDSEKILKKYESAKKGINYDDSEPEVVEETIKEKAEVKPSKVFDSASETSNSNHYTPSESKNNNLVIVVFGIAIIVFAAVYFLFLRGSTNEIIVETPYEEIIKEQNSRFEVKEEPKEKNEVQQNKDNFILRIDAKDTSWVKYIIDDSKIEEYILYPNSTKSIEANSSIDITLGNSGGISLFLNNEQLNFKGVKGRVRNLTIDANGFSSVSNN
jgi:cytoskeletal protein RodZ